MTRQSLSSHALSNWLRKAAAWPTALGALRVLVALALIVLTAPAFAQWQVAAHAVPLGRGAGVGFASAAPATAGQVLLDKGSSTNPAFTALGGDVSSVNSSGSVTLDPEIHCLAALTSAADKIAYYTSSGTCALGDFGSAVRTFNTTSSSANLRSLLTDEVGTGAAYFVGGALGTPASATLTNATGLPISGITGLGTGVGTALAVNTGSAGAPVLFNGAGGTPSSLTLTSATGLPLTSGVTGTLPVANGGTGITSLGTGMATWWGTPSSANLRSALTDESGTGAAYFQGGDLGTPSAGVLTSATGLPISTGVSGLGTGVATFLGTPSSANLASALTDETGTGSAVFSAGPTLTGTVTPSQALALSGDISPSQITADQNDYAPTGFSTSAVLRLDLDADHSLTGIAGGSDGLVKIIHNISTHVLTLVNQSASSTAVNRLLLGGDVTLNPDTSITLQYDATSSRWRAITSPGAGGGGGGGVSSVTIAAGSALTTSGTCTITTSGTCTVGLGSLTSNYVLLGNGTSSPQTVAPGTSGNVLTSNGTTWQSTAVAAPTTLGSPTATTSGTTIDYTSLPSGIKELTMILQGVSANANNTLLFQIGDGTGGLKTTGYVGSGGYLTTSGNSIVSSTAGMALSADTGAQSTSGIATLKLVNSSTNLWVMTFVGTLDGGAVMNLSTSYVTLSASLDRIRLTTTAGTAAFDAGSVNIQYNY